MSAKAGPRIAQCRKQRPVVITLQLWPEDETLADEAIGLHAPPAAPHLLLAELAPRRHELASLRLRCASTSHVRLRQSLGSMCGMRWDGRLLRATQSTLSGPAPRFQHSNFSRCCSSSSWRSSSPSKSASTPPAGSSAPRVDLASNASAASITAHLFVIMS